MTLIEDTTRRAETRPARLADAAGADLDALIRHPQIRIQPHIRRPDDAETAQKCLEMELSKLEAYWGAEQELREACEDIEALADEGLTWLTRRSGIRS